MTEQEALFTAAQLCNKYSLDYSPQGDCCDVLYSILFQEYIARALQDAYERGRADGWREAARRAPDYHDMPPGI